MIRTSSRPSRAAQCRVIAQDRSIDIGPLVNPRSQSGYYGVSLHHRGRSWLAKFKADGRLYRVGHAKTPEGAARILASYYRSIYGDEWVNAVQARKRQPYRIWEDAGGWRAAIYVLGFETPITGRFIDDRSGEVSPGVWQDRDSAKRALKLAISRWNGRMRAMLIR